MIFKDIRYCRKFKEKVWIPWSALQANRKSRSKSCFRMNCMSLSVCRHFKPFEFPVPNNLISRLYFPFLYFAAIELTWATRGAAISTSTKLAAAALGLSTASDSEADELEGTSSIGIRFRYIGKAQIQYENGWKLSDEIAHTFLNLYSLLNRS